MLWKLAVYWSYELQIFSPVFLKFWLFFSYMEYLYLYKIKFCFCCCSAPKSCLTLCDHMNCNMPGFPVLHCLPESAQIHVHWVSDSIQPPHPLPLSSPFAFNLSQHQGLFQWVALSIRWPKCWSFSFSISPSNEYSGLISFRINWFELLAVQETFKSLLQHHNSKTSVFRCSALFLVQLFHPYMTLEKP